MGESGTERRERWDGKGREMGWEGERDGLGRGERCEVKG